jgi:ABC-type Na+ transport system ATPase subunit NatA
VLFSSHLLDEVEEVADHVIMISEGRILLSAPLAEIRESHRVDGRVLSLAGVFHSLVGTPAAPLPRG